MFKKSVAVIIAFILVFASFSGAFADSDETTLSDISGHWAEKHIVNVYGNQIMSSIEGILFKPNEKMNEYDVLISISKMMRAEKVSNLSILVEKYNPNALEKYSVPEEAKEAVAFCLEKGIITTSELQLAKEHQAVTKNDASAYLGRAFGIKYDPTKTPDVLPFKDAITIPGPVRPHVAFLMSIDVIDSHNGNFNPYVVITRAIFAKMLDLSNEVYEKDYLDLEEIVTDDDSTVINEDNSSSEENVDKESETENTGSLPDPIEGESIITGYMEEVIPEYSRIVVNVKHSEDNIEKIVYNVPDNVDLIKDEVKSYYWRLKSGDVVNLYFKDGQITRIVAMSKVQKTEAVIKNKYIADKIILEVQTEKGESKSYAITKNTSIIKEGKQISFELLKTGMNISIITSYEELVEINADTQKTSDRGIVESISFSRTTPARIVIKKESGDKSEYYVSSTILDENIIIEGKKADLYSLRPGMQIDLALEDEDITKIVSVEYDSTIDLSGTVKSVNYDFGIMILEYMDTEGIIKTKNIYASKAKIVNKSLVELSIEDIVEGTKIHSVFGKEELGGIIAESIIVDKK